LAPKYRQKRHAENVDEIDTFFTLAMLCFWEELTNLGWCGSQKYEVEDWFFTGSVGWVLGRDAQLTLRGVPKTISGHIRGPKLIRLTTFKGCIS
jgi:hypothetical protein